MGRRRRRGGARAWRSGSTSMNWHCSRQPQSARAASRLTCCATGFGKQARASRPRAWRRQRRGRRAGKEFSTRRLLTERSRWRPTTSKDLTSNGECSEPGHAAQRPRDAGRVEGGASDHRARVHARRRRGVRAQVERVQRRAAAAGADTDPQRTGTRQAGRSHVHSPARCPADRSREVPRDLRGLAQGVGVPHVEGLRRFQGLPARARMPGRVRRAASPLPGRVRSERPTQGLATL